MYIHKLYREENREKILEFLRQNEFATLVTYNGEKPVASHLLMEIVEAGENLFVNGHMSKANSLWKTFEKNMEVLVIFQGPHTYISPTWYNHVNVPTWNYQSVHIYGKPRLVTEHHEAYGLLKRLVDRHEAGSHYKLSQNRDDENYRSIVSHLEERTDDLSQGVAEAMRRNRL